MPGPAANLLRDLDLGAVTSAGWEDQEDTGRRPRPGGMAPPPTNQGLLALVVMLIVLGFIIAYCCWGACCRLLGRRGGLDATSTFPDPPPLGFSQPAIVLLPYGRMLMVDGQLLDQLSEADLLALLDPANAPLRPDGDGRWTRRPSFASSAAALSKEDSESSVGRLVPPPSYQALFGGPPPSYEESLALRRMGGTTPQLTSLATTQPARTAVLLLTPAAPGPVIQGDMPGNRVLSASAPDLCPQNLHESIV